MHDFEEHHAVTEILVETLAELSLAQVWVVLHSGKKAKIIGKGMMLKTEQTVQHMFDYSQSKGTQPDCFTCESKPMLQRWKIAHKCPISFSATP